MKKIYLILSAGLVFLFSCTKETNNLVNLKDGDRVVIDSNYKVKSYPDAQPKNAFIEELTGVKCSNCPEAHEIIKTIRDHNPGRVVAISMHPFGQKQSEPYAGRTDFRTQTCNNIISMLGTYVGLPTANIDRKLLHAPNIFTEQRFLWEGFVDDEIKISSPVNITFGTRDYNSSKKVLKGSVKLVFTNPVNEPVYLTLELKESNITTSQELSDGSEDPAYVQNNIFRKTITAYNGMLLASHVSAGQAYVVNFDCTVLPDWVTNNMDIIAVVHHRSVTDQSVIQAAEISFQ